MPSKKFNAKLSYPSITRKDNIKSTLVIANKVKQSKMYDALSNLGFRNVSSGDTGNRVWRFFYGPRPETFLCLAKFGRVEKLIPFRHCENQRDEAIHKTPAFSLVEMLMALLVASLLMAALAPVMTKKINIDKIDASMIGNLSEKKVCGYVNDTFEDIKAEDCKAPSDAYFGSAIIVSGGGGGSGAVDSVKSPEMNLVYTGDTGATNNTTQKLYEFKFNKYIDSISISLTGGGGGGGGGNYNASVTPNATTCAEAMGTDTTGQSSYATYDSVNKLCVTKYNQVSNSDHALHKITAWNDTKCTSNYTHTCTSGPASMSYPYSGCQRPVCTHAGAVAACEALKPRAGGNWRLPKEAELVSWASQYAKLVLCNEMASPSSFPLAPQCAPQTTPVIAGTYSTTLWPHHYWSGDVGVGETPYSNYYFSGKWNKATLNSGQSPLSARCVASKVTNDYTGGGGGGGGHVKLKVPDEVIKYATKSGDALIKIYAGAGGKGGSKQNTESGINGSPSRVEVYSSGNISAPIWAVEITGGFPGRGASTTAGGAGGMKTGSGASETSEGFCRYLHKSFAGGNYDTEVKIGCNQIPGAGTSYGLGGVGGNSTTDEKGQGGAAFCHGSRGANTPVNTDGEDCKGGGGGICSIKTNGAISCTDGGNGGGGVVEITYTTKAPGMGGSGGGAGGLLHIVNFEIKPENIVKIQAGKRGKGGGSGTDGQDGGESYIEINGKKYSVSGGGGAKAGTAGIPPVDNLSEPTMPKTGKAGTGGKTENIIGSKFDGEDGSTGISGSSGNISISSGGNGGINPKISMFADIPCGGLSTVAIGGVACNRNSNIPTLLTRALTDNDFNSAFKSTYGAGATGGGGGGWSGNLSEGTTSASGANGLGGYVFVYFGGW